VFSPYYFRARQHALGGPHDHYAINVALYGARRSRWAFTEYPATHAHAARDTLSIGANFAVWNGSSLKILIDEIAAAVPTRIRGTIRVHVETLTDWDVPLDDAEHHHWSPIAPCARVEVDLDHPRVKWTGDAYLDTNRGDVALEESFHGWTWSRASVHE